MGRKSETRARKAERGEFIVYDVTYEDGSLSSNRRVPTEALDRIDPDRAAKAFLEAQDREIAARSGRPRGAIKSVKRARR